MKKKGTKNLEDLRVGETVEIESMLFHEGVTSSGVLLTADLILAMAEMLKTARVVTGADGRLQLWQKQRVTRVQKDGELGFPGDYKVVPVL